MEAKVVHETEVAKVLEARYEIRFRKRYVAKDEAEVVARQRAEGEGTIHIPHGLKQG